MSVLCFHCGLPVPDGVDLPVEFQGKSEPTCCAGCQAVAQSILSAGLGEYYQHRTVSPAGPVDIPEDFLAQLKLYDDAGVQANFVHQSQQGDTVLMEAALILEGITCAACVWLNEQHLKRLPGVVAVDINYSSYRARVRWQPEQIALSDILEAISAIGYRAYPYDLARQENLAQKNRKKALNRLWVAGLSMMQVMMYAVPVYIAGVGEIPLNYLWLLHWASFLLTLPVMLYSAVPFYQGSIRDLKARRVGMDVPIALAIVVTFLASTYALIMKIEHGIYFDSVSMFVFLLLGARYLEQMARQKAGAAAENLVRLTPAFCHVVSEPYASQVTERTVASLQIGEIVLLKPGESIPADGKIVAGESAVDEALLTGESHPRPCSVGDFLIAGSVNVESSLYLKVEKIGQETRLAAIVRLLDLAMAQKPHWAVLADKIAAHFVAFLLMVAALTFAYWWQVDSARALWVTVAVLVVSCPCALSLATPAALTAATGSLAQAGVLLTRAEALELLPQVDDVVFDKTGTLTFGRPRLLDRWILAKTEPLSLLRTLEHRSEHPLARALLEYAADAPLLADLRVQNLAGKGLEGVNPEGQRFRVGTLAFVAELAGDLPSFPPNFPADKTLVALGKAGEWLAIYALGDELRPDAAAALEHLHTLGKRLHLLSGDTKGSVEKLACTLKFDQYQAESLPEDKLKYVQNLQNQGRRVLMLGDGVNDAPVLACADVSFAMGSGTDVARASADCILMGEQVMALCTAFAQAARTRRLIRQNIIWALVYNVAALPLAASGWVTPWLASLGMALSSLLVVSNALRLLTLPKE